MVTDLRSFAAMEKKSRSSTSTMVVLTVLMVLMSSNTTVTEMKSTGLTAWTEAKYGFHKSMMEPKIAQMVTMKYLTWTMDTTMTITHSTAQMTVKLTLNQWGEFCALKGQE